jgi:crotonobetainyl-CoA:carnitine CoA-transferase CaiB-like acyl-CoA transferase
VSRANIREHAVSALSSFKIVELAEHVAGEYCGKLLSDFGAVVIKVERPGGSPTRQLGPFAPQGEAPERSGLFAYLNTNKTSVPLDLTAAAGRDALAELLQDADAVIDDHAPGWLASVGLDPASYLGSYPRLSLCAITPFGQSAPDNRRHAEDLTVLQASGWGYHTPSAAESARPPLKGAGRFQASYEAGLDAAMCLAACLYGQGSQDRGRLIDVSKQEVMASRVDYVLSQMVAGDLEVGTGRTLFDLGGPSGIFPCRDGFVYIWMSAPSHWDAIRQLLDDTAWMDDFPANWMERGLTPERVAICRAHIIDWLKTLDKDDAAAIAQTKGLTLAPVNNVSDLPRSEQLRHRGFFAAVEHPAQGRALYPTVPYKLSATPARIAQAAPLLGQNDTAMPQKAAGTLAHPGNGQNKIVKRRGGPLEGVRVLELTKVWAGPFVGKQLAYLGAEVIRIESLGSIDVTRSYGVDDINKAPGFQAVNPQKLSAQIDMKSKEGIALLMDLIGKCDIVVENLRPGAIDRLGLGYAAVKAAHPGIVYVSMGMYGNDGPLAYQTGYAPCFVALSGLSALVGYEGETPRGMNIRYADSSFGTAAAYAALVALLHRQRTGEGQFIDLSAVETMTSMIGDVFMDYSLNGTIAHCDGNRHPDMAPHGLYHCADEDWISIAISSEPAWRALCAAMEQPALPADARFSTLAARKANEVALDDLISQWTRGRDAQALTSMLQARGIAAAKSANSLDLVADDHLWARGFYRYVTDGAGDTKATVGPAWHITDGADITDGAPRLGEHNAYVFGDVLGLAPAEQERLAQAGIIR